MAEIKRIPLQSAPIQDVPKQSAKKSEKSEKKKKEKEKQIAPSFRFMLNLHESNEERCPEFNYSDLLKKAETKRRKEKKKDENNGSNGLSAFDENADDEKVLDVARYFEQKYGNRKKSDYVDLGAGYDESDSFIDNTDAYDELVPEEVTTVHGGFYVNSGPLEFKDSGKAPGHLKRNNHDNGNGNDDDDDEEDESSDEDSDENEEIATKPVSKRSLSSSDETEESTRPPKSKSRKEEPTEINLVD